MRLIQSKDEKMEEMIEYESLVTPLLISVQGFAFRRRPLSLLVACAPINR